MCVCVCVCACIVYIVVPLKPYFTKASPGVYITKTTETHGLSKSLRHWS